MNNPGFIICYRRISYRMLWQPRFLFVVLLLNINHAHLLTFNDFMTAEGTYCIRLVRPSFCPCVYNTFYSPICGAVYCRLGDCTRGIENAYIQV